MILRRVIEHLRKQEWTAIAIDFVIVVVGVFVGMQVTNWNEARANRGIVDRHLAEIVEDLDSHLALNDALYGSAVARVGAVDYIYERAFNRELPRTLVLSTESWDAPPTPPMSLFCMRPRSSCGPAAQIAQARSGSSALSRR